jgi:SAM-dependent methyltransferase
MLVRPPRLPFPLDDAEPWATATDREYFTSREPFRFYRSPSQGVVFIDPVPSDRLKEIYPPTYYSYAAPGASWVQRVKSALDRRAFRAVLREVPGDPLAALDVGGGAGWLLDDVRAADPRVRFTRVIDIDPAPAALAESHGHAYFAGRIEDFEPDRAYDFVLLLNLIEHVEEPLSILEKVRGLLAPRGRVLVKTPNWESLDARIFRHRSWAGYHCPRHWVLFNRESFTRLADLAGLEVRRFSYTQGAGFWAASVAGWLASKGVGRADYDHPIVEHPLFDPLSAAFAAFDFARAPVSKTSQMFFELAAR